MTPQEFAIGLSKAFLKLGWANECRGDLHRQVYIDIWGTSNCSVAKAERIVCKFSKDNKIDAMCVRFNHTRGHLFVSLHEDFKQDHYEPGCLGCRSVWKRLKRGI